MIVMQPATEPDLLIPSRPDVVPLRPTIGAYGMHSTRSAVPGPWPAAFSDAVRYFMLGLQQGLTPPNISLQGLPPHAVYIGMPPIPTSDRPVNC